MDYGTNLDSLTDGNDSRIYRDFYNDTTKKEIREFVLKYLSNSNFTNITNDDGINNYIEREVKKNQKIEKALYVYNYFRRFYDIDINGMKLYDFVLFNMQGFNQELTMSKIVNLYFTDPTNFNTSSTNNTYVKLLKPYTLLDGIPEFLEYLVNEFTDDTIDHFVASHFKGWIVEIGVDSHPEIQYTLWDHFSNQDEKYVDDYKNRLNFLLPILTLPENSSYIISSPAQYIIGSLRTYMVDPNNPEEAELFKVKFDAYVERMKTYYNTVADLLGDDTLFNNIHIWQLDKRYAYDKNGFSTYQALYVTEDPFHKNFNEVVGVWPHDGANAAGASGSIIRWESEGLFDGNILSGESAQEYTFETWSHESAHNIDARLFMKNNDRRDGTGGEDMADNFLMQSFNETNITMNFSRYFESDARIASNLKPETINSEEKIKTYYDRLFQVIYIMDYLEGRAFLQLEPEEQAVVAVQASYLEGDEDSEADRIKKQRTLYKQISADEYRKMNLQTIDNLYENNLLIYPGAIDKVNGINMYGGENILNVHWYQPNNPRGRADSYSFKWFSYEMLGYVGYTDGFVEFASNINAVNGTKTDTDVLNKITGYSDFNTYKKMRFDETYSKLKNIDPEIIKVDDYVQKFYDALVKDAEETDKKVNDILKRHAGEGVTDIASCKTKYWCNRGLEEARGYSESSKIRKDIFYAFKDYTNDFSVDVYDTETKQEIGNLIVKKEVDKESSSDTGADVNSTDSTN